MPILADKIDPKSTETVDAVLYGDKRLDVSKADPQKFWLGAGLANVPNRILMADALGQAVKVTNKDVNGDGLTDAVFTFVQKDVAKRLVAGTSLHDVWLYGYAGDKRISTMDTVAVIK